MIGYLLDTCVISDFVKGDKPTLHKLKQTPPNLLSISTITSMEIEFGLQLNSTRAKIIAPIMSAFLANIHLLSYSEADAHAAAAIRASLQKTGKPIGAYDVLLAGCAVSRGLILVSSNMREFERVSGLQLENWRI